MQLAGERGDLEELRRLAAGGSSDAVGELVQLAAERGDLEELRRLAEGGSSDAGCVDRACRKAEAWRETGATPQRATLRTACESSTGRNRSLRRTRLAMRVPILATPPSSPRTSPRPAELSSPEPTPSMTQTANPEPTAQPTASSEAAIRPDTVVATTVDGLSVRRSPGPQGQRIGFLELGTVAFVLAGPTDVDGVPWYAVSGMGLPYASGCMTTPPG